ncbi:delta endotoxin C-terminal domain-containing protein [Bacillus thuringiensis]|uniref:delta endotoxin C-terminal domain-containing protein n=1 Tax=Bacillus thuringiensis TaxID=1428 RepID=UPI000BFE9E81|nr:delta endotoxin C-terminal domain-containing protein [Bacillus thuringiensis]PGW35219.1 hypothetical protein COE03_29735 [Bacillus thuringiensis]
MALEWINGANAVKVEYGAFLSLKTTNLVAGKYHVRVRYANPSNSPVTMYQEAWVGGTKIQGGGLLFPSTKSPDSNNVVYVTGQQGNYVVQDISWPTGGNLGNLLNLPSGDIKVKLSGNNNNGTFIYVDRIEFIPFEKPKEIIALPAVQFASGYMRGTDIWKSPDRKTAFILNGRIQISENSKYYVKLYLQGNVVYTWYPPSRDPGTYPIFVSNIEFDQVTYFTYGYTRYDSPGSFLRGTLSRRD